MRRRSFPIGVVVSLVVTSFARADLEGDEVGGRAGRYVFGALTETPFDTTATVGASREFEGTTSGDFATVFADLTSNTLTVGIETSLVEGISGRGNNLESFRFDFSDLDWVGMQGEVTGLTLIDSGNNTTNATDGWDTDPGSWTISTTADSIFIDTISGWSLSREFQVVAGRGGGELDPEGLYTTFATFEIETVHIPLPGAALLGMLGLGMVPFVRRYLPI